MLWLGVAKALERFEQLAHEGVSRELRVAMDEDTWRIFLDHSWTGTGLGTLIAVYPRYESFYNGTIEDHAHNDFLELLADTGLIGGLCGAFFIGVLFRQGFVNFRIAIAGAERALIVGPRLLAWGYCYTAWSIQPSHPLECVDLPPASRHVGDRARLSAAPWNRVYDLRKR